MNALAAAPGALRRPRSSPRTPDAAHTHTPSDRRHGRHRPSATPKSITLRIQINAFRVDCLGFPWSPLAESRRARGLPTHPLHRSPPHPPPSPGRTRGNSQRSDLLGTGREPGRGTPPRRRPHRHDQLARPVAERRRRRRDLRLADQPLPRPLRGRSSIRDQPGTRSSPRRDPRRHRHPADGRPLDRLPPGDAVALGAATPVPRGLRLHERHPLLLPNRPAPPHPRHQHRAPSRPAVHAYFQPAARPARPVHRKLGRQPRLRFHPT